MLAVSHLRKTFDRVVAVDDISLTVRRGEVYGLLGPNGAGKTTTIRTVLDIIKPDAGEITFDGKPFTQALWNRIGYLPEERGLYRKSKVLSTILYFAALKGVSAAEAKPIALKWLERFDLADAPHRKVEELSKGNQQKVQIICSLIHEPELIIFDEPFSGLDPVNQILLKDILLELRKKNLAIIFSTHQMEQVERLCDNLSLINKGKTVLQGSIREVKKAHGTNTVHIEFEGDGAFLARHPGVEKADVYPNYAELQLTDESHARGLLSKASADLTVKKFELREPSLQAIFVSVVGGEEKIQKAASQSIEGRKRPEAVSGMSPKVKKELIRFGLGAGVVATFVGIQVVQGAADTTLIALLMAALGFSGFRVFKVKREEEKRAAAEGATDA